MTDQERIRNAENLIGDIMEAHTENTEVDIACRNIARMFQQILTDEEVEFE